MKDFMLILFSFIFLAIICLLWANRDSDKVFTALVVVLTTSLATGAGALLVSLKPERISEKFMVVFVYDKKETRPILSKTHSINKRFAGCGAIWAFSNQESIEKASANLSGLLMDFLARCIVEKWTMLYQPDDGKLPEFQVYDWSPKHTTQLVYYLDESKGFLNTRVPFNNILQLLKDKGNIFFTTSGTFSGFDLILPHDTDFSYSSGDSDREIRLHNRFVDYTVNIKRISSVALSEDYYNLVEIDKEDSGRYELVSFALNTEAQFSGWWNGSPKMKLYKYWINSLNLLFEREFDWKPCLAEIKEEWIEEKLGKREAVPGPKEVKR